MSGPPRLYADFQNSDSAGRVRLNTVGTSKDLDEVGLRLWRGLRIVLCEPGELEADGHVEWSFEEAIWVARLGSVRHLD